VTAYLMSDFNMVCMSLVTRQNGLLFLLNCLPVDGCCVVRYACT
jgi:hypothetical protein